MQKHIKTTPKNTHHPKNKTKPKKRSRRYKKEEGRAGR
jgi:hypothetical protein